MEQDEDLQTFALDLASQFAAKISNLQLGGRQDQKTLMKTSFSVKQAMAYDLAREWKMHAGYSDNEKVVLMQLANAIDAELNMMTGMESDENTSVWKTVQSQ